MLEIHQQKLKLEVHQQIFGMLEVHQLQVGTSPTAILACWKYTNRMLELHQQLFFMLEVHQQNNQATITCLRLMNCSSILKISLANRPITNLVTY